MIRQFSIDGINSMSSITIGETWVFHNENGVTYMLYSSGRKPECNWSPYLLDDLIKSPKFKEIPQDKLYFQAKSKLILENRAVGFTPKKCSCEMSNLLNYGCKCGGV